MPRDERRVGPIDDDELVRHALGVGEREAVAGALGGDALAAEPVGPEVERLGRGDARDDACAPSPGRDGPAIAPGYSKNVRSAPPLPSSSA